MAFGHKRKQGAIVPSAQVSCTSLATGTDGLLSMKSSQQKLSISPDFGASAFPFTHGGKSILASADLNAVKSAMEDIMKELPNIPTSAIEAAARAIHQVCANKSGRARPWEAVPPARKAEYRQEAGAALMAGLQSRAETNQ